MSRASVCESRGTRSQISSTSCVRFRLNKWRECRLSCTRSDARPALTPTSAQPARIGSHNVLWQVWERFTYSGLYKREFALQQQASSSPLLESRVGVALASDTPRFAPLEHRLSGADAVDGLIELLRLRMEKQRKPHSASMPLIDHGPDRQLFKPIVGFRPPDTDGVQ